MEEKDLILEEKKEEDLQGLEDVVEEAVDEVAEEVAEEPVDEATVETKKKKKKKSNIIYTILMIFCLGVFAFAGYNLYTIYSDYEEIEEYYEEIRFFRIRVKTKQFCQRKAIMEK